MRAKALLLVICTTILPLFLPSGSFGSDRRISIRGHGGYGTIAMGDVNEIIEQQNDLVSQGGLGDQFDKFNGGLIFGLDLIGTVNKQVCVIFSYDRVSESVTHSLTATEGFYKAEMSTEGNFFSAGLLAFLKPGLPWYFLGKGGYGEGKSIQDMRVVEGQTEIASQGHDAKGTGFTVEVGLGGQHQFSSEGSLFGFIEAAYRYRNLGQFKGKGYQNGETGRGTVSDATGNPLDFDYSGIALKAGLGFTL